MTVPFDKIGIIGAGSMGSNMAMLFAENGLTVSAYDASPQNVDNLSALFQAGLAPELHSKISAHKDFTTFIESLGGTGAAKLLVLSIPHGGAADAVLAQADDYLRAGDIILDGGNEWYEHAQRRQGALAPRGVAYLSMGVSGG